MRILCKSLNATHIHNMENTQLSLTNGLNAVRFMYKNTAYIQ